MNLILVGLPGAGKGTQAAYITEEYDIPHISTGDMFRAAIKNETELGLEAKKYMDEGNLVPDAVTNGLVRERLEEADTEEGFLLDGYPRTLNQAEALDTNLEDIDRSLDAVLYIEVDESILMDRLSGRFICSNCGATYHKLFNKPSKEGICDNCGSTEFYQRDDDKPETVKKRISVNKDTTQELVEFYKEKDILETIDGEGEPEEIFQAIKNVIDNLK